MRCKVTCFRGDGKENMKLFLLITSLLLMIAYFYQVNARTRNGARAFCCLVLFESQQMACVDGLTIDIAILNATFEAGHCGEELMQLAIAVLLG